MPGAIVPFTGGGGGGGNVNAMQMNLQINAFTSNTVNNSFSRVNAGLRSIQRQAVITSGALGRMTRGLLAFGGGLAIGAGITSFLRQSVKLGKDAENNTAALNTVLRGNLRLRGQDVGLAKEQLSILKQQAHVLQEHTGIYEQIFIKGAGVLSQSHEAFAQIRQMQPWIANVLVYQREMGKSAAQLEQTYMSIGRMLATGQARGLSNIIPMSPEDRKLAESYALMGGKRGKQLGIELIENKLRMFQGAAFDRLKTDLGQIDLAMAHIQSVQANIGQAIIPIQNQLTILFGQIISIMGPDLISLIKGINVALMEHRDQIRSVATQGWKMLTKVVREGWDKWNEALRWWHDNSYWVQPWLQKVAAGFGALMIVSTITNLVIGLRNAFILLDLSNPFTALGLAATIGAYEAIQHWSQVKKWMQGFAEWIVGSKVYNPDAKGGVVTMKALPKNAKWTVPRAQATQPGLFGGLKKSWDNWIDGISPSTRAALKDITLQWDTFTQHFNTDLDGAQKNRLPQLLILLTKIGGVFKWWDDMLFGTAIDFFIKGCDNLLIVVNKLHDAWKEIFQWFIAIHPEAGKGTGPSTGDSDPYGQKAGRSGKRDWSKSGVAANSVWSPFGDQTPFQPDSSGKRTLNAIWNNPGGMGPTKSALAFGATPSGAWDTGHTFMKFPTKEAGAAAQFSMWWNGAYRNHTLAEAIYNWIGKGEHGEAEYISEKLGMPLNTRITDDMLKGPVGIRIMQAQAHWEGANVLTPGQWKAGQDKWKVHQGIPVDTPPPNSGAGVTIHNNVTYHVHGGDAVHQIAHLHQKHIDQLAKDMDEAHYRLHRSRFA